MANLLYLEMLRCVQFNFHSQNQLLELKKYLIYKSHFGQQFLLSLILSVLNFFDIKLSISFKENCLLYLYQIKRNNLHSSYANILKIFHLLIQSTPDNSNLQGNAKKVRVIRSSKKIAGSKEKKNTFYCTVNISITLILEMLSEN